MKIYILDLKNEIKIILIMESDNVSALKREMKKKYNISDEVELLFNGILLNDNDYLIDAGISDGATINYSGIFKAGLNNLK